VLALVSVGADVVVLFLGIGLVYVSASRRLAAARRGASGEGFGASQANPLACASPYASEGDTDTASYTRFRLMGGFPGAAARTCGTRVIRP
jgi:hypothetical protein